MKITKLDEAAKQAVRMEGASGVSKQVPVSKQDGSPRFSFRVFTFEPGGHTPFHSHPNEHINYVIEGSGTVVTAGGEERPIKKGDFVLILPDEKHQYRSSQAGQPLVMICAVPVDYE